MIKKNLLLSIFFTVIIGLVSAQTDFRPGFIITNNLDTVYGLVDYRGEIRNSKICTFQKSENDTICKYLPGEIYAYRFTDGKFYISKTIKAETVFLEYLVNGKVNLYFIKYPDHIVYYLEKNNNLMELSNEELDIYVDGKGYYKKETNKHIGYLKYGFADCMEIQPQINDVQLNHESLTKLAVNYHEMVCDGEKCIVYQKKVPYVQTKLVPYIGFETSFLNFEDVDFDASFSPNLGLIISNTLPHISEKLNLNFEFNYGYHYFYGYKKSAHNDVIIHYDYHYRFSILKSFATLMYVYPKGKVRPFFEAGGGLMFILYPEYNQITEAETAYSVRTTEGSGNEVDPMTFTFKLTPGVNYYYNNFIFYGGMAYCHSSYLNSIALNLGIRL